jgi:hypothetical protein
LVYQRKDWINSDGKTVKPHDHEEDPEYANKAKRKEEIATRKEGRQNE